MKKAELKEKFIELRAVGHSYVKISEMIGVSKQTLINWSREFQSEIENLRNIETEALQQQFYLAKQSRIELLGTVLEKVKGEIAKRDFRDVTSDRLIELSMKLCKCLDQEREDTTFSTTEYVHNSGIDIDNVVQAKRIEWTG